jgi:hypothetical protein
VGPPSSQMLLFAVAHVLVQMLTFLFASAPLTSSSASAASPHKRLIGPMKRGGTCTRSERQCDQRRARAHTHTPTASSSHFFLTFVVQPLPQRENTCQLSHTRDIWLLSARLNPIFCVLPSTHKPMKQPFCRELFGRTVPHRRQATQSTMQSRLLLMRVRAWRGRWAGTAPSLAWGLAPSRFFELIKTLRTRVWPHLKGGRAHRRRKELVWI